MTDTSQWGDRAAEICRYSDNMRAAIAADDLFLAAEGADDLYSAAHFDETVEDPTTPLALTIMARRLIESLNAPELYREALARALVGSNKVKMREAVDGLATLVSSLEWLRPETSYWLEVLQAISKGVYHDAIYVASTRERPNAIPPVARRAAKEALSRRRLRQLGLPC